MTTQAPHSRKTRKQAPQQQILDPAFMAQERAKYEASERERAAKRAARLAPRPRETQAKMNRWRSILFAGLLPLTLLTLAYGVKVFYNYKAAYETINQYTLVNYTAAVDASRPQHFLNVFEPWKAPFNTGTAYALGGAWVESREQLELALGLAKGAEQCPVRANYAFVVESQGDDAFVNGDYLIARDFYLEAKKIADESPEECADASSANQETTDESRDLSQSLPEASDRDQRKADLAQQQAEKQEQEQQNGGGGQGEQNGGQSGGEGNEQQGGGGQQQGGQSGGEGNEQQQGGGGGGESETEQQLRGQMQQGQQERDDQNDRGGGGSPSDKPW